MKVINSKVNHVRYTDYEEKIISLMTMVVEDTRTVMRSQGCDLMYNTQTGECVTLDEFDRIAGILSGLSDMDEILKE